MTTDNDRVEISVRLLQNGRYTWAITSNNRLDHYREGVDILHSLDGYLRDKFPDHVYKASGRIAMTEE